MTKAKVAVTIDEDLVGVARHAVAQGRAASLSAYVEKALRAWIEDDFDLLLDQMLEETGGPMTAEERAWADAVLDR